MYKFSWVGNNGCCFPDPGEIKKAKCGICGVQMNVERDVFCATGFAEAMGRFKHFHDCFTCPHLMERWHRKIVDMKMEVWSQIVNNFGRIEQSKEKTMIRKLEKKVKKILKDVEK